MKTHYEILGVQETASNDEIQRAFRKAAMKWHPDHNRGNEQAATALFKQATDAKNVLLNAQSRTNYDRVLAAGRTPPAPPVTPAPHAASPQPPSTPRPQTASPSPQRPSPAPAPQPKQSAAVDRDVWLGMALGFAAQGADHTTVADALKAKGCTSPEAEQIAIQAVAMQPTSSTFQQPTMNSSRPTPQSASIWSAAWPLIGLVALASLLLGVVKLSSTPATAPVAAAASSVAAATANFPPPTVLPSKTWSAQLPSDVLNFDEAAGKGEIRYTSLPGSDEFSYFREKQGEVFEIRLLQIVPMSGSRQLLLFSSRPSDFECHACHPLLSAMLVRSESGKPYATVLPLQILGTAGRFGSVSLEGDRRVSLLKVGPRREGFVFKDGDAGQGSIVEWGNLFSIEKDRFRPLGSFHVHEDSFASGFCDEQKKALCAQKDTSIRFSRGDAKSEYFDILASEVTIDPYTGAGLPTTRNYVLRFNGEQFAEKVEASDLPASAGSAPAPVERAASASINP